MSSCHHVRSKKSGCVESPSIPRMCSRCSGKEILHSFLFIRTQFIRTSGSEMANNYGHRSYFTSSYLYLFPRLMLFSLVLIKNKGCNPYRRWSMNSPALSHEIPPSQNQSEEVRSRPMRLESQIPLLGVAGAPSAHVSSRYK